METTRPPGRPPGRPPRLTRAGIVEAALALVAEDGLEALTMRALARSLGADPMALYRHVRDKEALLGAMCDALMARLDPIDTDGGWEPQLRGWATGLHDQLVAAPALVPVVVTAPVTPAALELSTQVLELLRAAGFSDALATRAIGLVFGYVLGAAVLDAAPPAPVPPGTDPAAAALFTDDTDFAFGLGVVLDGLARRRREQPPGEVSARRG